MSIKITSGTAVSMVQNPGIVVDVQAVAPPGQRRCCSCGRLLLMGDRDDRQRPMLLVQQMLLKCSYCDAPQAR